MTKRILTDLEVSSTVTSTGDITAGNNLRSSYSAGDEGGQIFLNKSVTNTSINSGVNIDVYQNKLRIWEDGGTNRGVYIDITTAGAGVGTNLLGTATDTNYYPSTIVFNAGTTAGPTLDLTMSGTGAPDLTAVAIPSAGTGASGIVTNAAQEFGGVKTFTSPAIKTSITTPTTGTFDLINTTATTVNFAGAATTLNLGAGNIAKTINLGTNTSSTTTVNIGTSATSSSTINLQGPFINVGRATSSAGSITGVDTFIEGAATSTSGASASVNGGNLWIAGGAANQEDEFNTASVQGGNVYIDGGSTATISGTVTKGSVLIGSTTDTRAVTIGRTGISTTLPGSLSADSLTVGGGYGSTGVSITNTGLLSTNSNIVVDGNGTFGNLVGTGTRNVNSTSAGILTNSTSSARYKQDIVDAEYVYDDILRLQPKTFKLKSEVEELENPVTYAGFIAEDVDEIDSLKVFVGYAKTPDGELIPDSLYYAEMVSALVSAIKHQDTMIKSLQTRIEQLENN